MALRSPRPQLPSLSVCFRCRCSCPPPSPFRPGCFTDPTLSHVRVLKPIRPRRFLDHSCATGRNSPAIVVAAKRQRISLDLENYSAKHSHESKGWTHDPANIRSFHGRTRFLLSRISCTRMSSHQPRSVSVQKSLRNPMKLRCSSFLGSG